MSSKVTRCCRRPGRQTWPKWRRHWRWRSSASNILRPTRQLWSEPAYFIDYKLFVREKNGELEVVSPVCMSTKHFAGLLIFDLFVNVSSSTVLWPPPTPRGSRWRSCCCVKAPTSTKRTKSESTSFRFWVSRTGNKRGSEHHVSAHREGKK